MEGTTLADGRYVLGRRLGSGGMASVYQATDTRLHVERAIKILAPELARSSKLMERFEREARVMAQLEHPNIVPVHDVGRDGEVVYLVMSLFQAGSLDDHLLNTGPLPPRDATLATIGVVKALTAAHNRGIIHRDVKPQNVLIDPHGHPRLCDFGIAHVATDNRLTGTGAQLGTWAFMAPEQRVGQSIDARTDVYATASMLLMLLTGEIPNDLHAVDSHPEQFKNVPDDLRSVITRGTRFRPDDRYPTAAALQQALEDALSTLTQTPPIRLGATPRVVQRTTTNETLVGWGDSLAGDVPALLADTRAAPQTSTGWMAKGLGVVTAVGVVALGVTLLALAVGWAAWSVTAGPTVADAEQPAADVDATPSPVPVADADTEAEPIPLAEPTPSAEPAPLPTPAPAPQPRPALTPEVVSPQVEPADIVVAPDAEPDTQPEPIPEPVANLPEYRVTITSVPWSSVTIDGTSEGTTLWTDDLPSGQYTVRLRAEGHPDLIRRLTVADGPLAFCWDFSAQAVCAR